MNNHCCKEMQTHLQSQEVAIIYIPKFREYGIRYLDGGSSFQEICFCPWCGKSLPVGLREEWMKKIASMGLQPTQENIPQEYKTDTWWSKT